MKVSTGYSCLENTLYRIEVHDSGKTGTRKKPTFKWSRKNGSITARISKICDRNLVLDQNSMGGFDVGDWAEVTDDLHELNQEPGTFVKIIEKDETRLKFDDQNEIGKPITEEYYQSNDKPTLRKWGSKPINIVTQCFEEDYIHLENDVKIQFSKGSYRTGDYWLMPCRPQRGLIWEVVNDEFIFIESHGVEHHYCPLAVIKKHKNGIKLVSDCRKFFRALSS